MLAFDILKRIIVKSYGKQTTAVNAKKEEAVHDGKRALAVFCRLFLVEGQLASTHILSASRT
jgi:hypothetical protein